MPYEDLKCRHCECEINQWWCGKCKKDIYGQCVECHNEVAHEIYPTASEENKNWAWGYLTEGQRFGKRHTDG